METFSRFIQISHISNTQIIVHMTLEVEHLNFEANIHINQCNKFPI